jgi:predicted nucleic-acid-binding Zn-ribbon protein
MKQNHTCPKCRSTDVIGNVRPLDATHSDQRTARLATYRNPNALLFKGQQWTSMTAWVCAQCGYVEFYADDPNALKVKDG